MKLLGFCRSDESSCRNLPAGDDFGHFIEVTCSYFVLMFRCGVTILFRCELSFLQVGICCHAARPVAARKFKHAVVKRMETGERHKLKFVAHGSEFALEF